MFDDIEQLYRRDVESDVNSLLFTHHKLLKVKTLRSLEARIPYKQANDIPYQSNFCLTSPSEYFHNLSASLLETVSG